MLLLSPKDPWAFKMLPVSQLVRANGQAVARADIESKPSPPNLFSSFPLHQEATGAVAKQLVWALISTSHRGHPVAEPTYSHHLLDSDLDITAAELTPSDARFENSSPQFT